MYDSIIKNATIRKFDGCVEARHRYEQLGVIIEAKHGHQVHFPKHGIKALKKNKAKLSLVKFQQ